MIKTFEENKEQSRTRNDLKCLSIGTVWDKAKFLASQEGRTVSSYIREVIKQKYRNSSKKKEVLINGE